jgi:hypothetical protein
VDETMVGPRLLGHPPRRDAGGADLDEQALGRVEQRLLGLVAWAIRWFSHSTYTID